jgi:predicted metalloprotease
MSFGGGGMMGRGLGLGGAAVLLILSLVFGKDFFSLLGDSGTVQEAPSSGPIETTPAEEHEVDFVSFVLDSAQATWSRLLPEAGARYHDARLVLFRDAIESACGFAQSASGPFYCPGDEKVYVDLSFFEELKSRFGAPGDFAQAYVLAHEIGHHVQHILGLDAAAARGRSNQASVSLELQADCLAGVWGNRAARNNMLESGDVDEGLAAASAVGDDRLQKMTTGQVTPETFTHGSSAQRVAAFKQGFAAGRLQDCVSTR